MGPPRIEASFGDTVDRVLTWTCQGVEASFVGVVDRVLTWVWRGVEASFLDTSTW
jgi:hypothetical protein